RVGSPSWKRGTTRRSDGGPRRSGSVLRPSAGPKASGSSTADESRCRSTARDLRLTDGDVPRPRRDPRLPARAEPPSAVPLREGGARAGVARRTVPHEQRPDRVGVDGLREQVAPARRVVLGGLAPGRARDDGRETARPVGREDRERGCAGGRRVDDDQAEARVRTQRVERGLRASSGDDRDAAEGEEVREAFAVAIVGREKEDAVLVTFHAPSRPAPPADDGPASEPSGPKRGRGPNAGVAALRAASPLRARRAPARRAL